MASLNNILNPESSPERDVRRRNAHERSRSPSTSPAAASSDPVSVEPYYTQNNILIKPHESHADCPSSLACLPDTTGRPQHTLPVILRCAILGSPKKRLTIREIYAAMEKKYPYYTTAGPAWKQSVRHHLSLNRLFERQPRPPTDPGFGSYWTVNLDAPPGTKRPRKRGRAAKHEPERAISVTTVAAAEKKRGKQVQLRAQHEREHIPHPFHFRSKEEPVQHELPLITTLRPVDAHSFNTSIARGSPFVDNDDDEMTCEERAGPETSDDDVESEDGSYAFNHRMYPLSDHSSIGRGRQHPYLPPPVRTGLHGAFSTWTKPEHPNSTVDRLRMEMEGLKRQSNDAHTTSVRMLNDAKADVYEMRAQLRMAESRLEDEKRRRIEAEMIADEEARRRRAAEDALLALQSHRSHRTHFPSR